MAAYYNEFDPKAAAWLRELIRCGHIAPGDVDERSILDVTGNDVKGYTQCHFFAGIGGWSLALRMAGWSDDKPVWTGSCPCQPFSAAGKRKGVDDERHVWPEFARLIGECEPAICFGEQVASKDGRGWLAGARADLEAMGYAVGAADLCAAGVGAPHIRQRLWWLATAVADPNKRRRGAGVTSRGEASPRGTLAFGSVDPADPADSFVANAIGSRRNGRASKPRQQAVGRAVVAGASAGGRRLGNAGGKRCDGINTLRGAERGAEAAGASNPWASAIWLPCGDGKARRIEPTIEPLVDGLPGRVGLLRGAGNAIVPQLAAEFIQAALEALDTP